MTTENKTIASNEVRPKTKRRLFTSAYKADIVARANACTEPGEVGKLLRQESLYSSHLFEWRKAAKAGTLKALGRKRGPKKKRTAAEVRAEKAEREVADLRKKLKFAEDVIDVQKKLSVILGVKLNPPQPPNFDDE